MAKFVMTIGELIKMDRLDTSGVIGEIKYYVQLLNSWKVTETGGTRINGKGEIDNYTKE